MSKRKIDDDQTDDRAAKRARRASRREMLRRRLDTLRALAVQIQAELASAEVDLNDASSDSSDEDVCVRPPANDRAPPITSPHAESERRDDVSTLTPTVHDAAAGIGKDASGTSTPAPRRPSRLPRLKRSAPGSASASARSRGRPQSSAQEIVAAQRLVLVDLLSGTKVSRPYIPLFEIHITKNAYVLGCLEQERGGTVTRVAIPLPDLSEAEAAALSGNVRVQATYPMDKSDDPWHYRHVRISIYPVDDEADRLLEFGYDKIPTARERLFLDFCEWSRWVLRASQSIDL